MLISLRYWPKDCLVGVSTHMRLSPNFGLGQRQRTDGLSGNTATASSGSSAAGVNTTLPEEKILSDCLTVQGIVNIVYIVTADAARLIVARYSMVPVSYFLPLMIFFMRGLR